MNQLAIKKKLLIDPQSISFNEYKTLLSDKIDTILLYEINCLINSSKLNADDFIKILLPIVKNDEHLLLIALCLRNGADPNLYIDTGREDNSVIHILVYIYLLYNKPEDELLKNTIVMMFLLSKSDPKLSYNETAKLSVVEYLNMIKFKHILSINIKTNINNKLLIKLATLLDNPDLLSSENTEDIVTNLSLIEIIRDHSINIFRERINELLPQLNSDKSIEYSIKFINIKIFIILLNLGIYPSYNEVNIIILYIITQSESIKNIFREFLKEYIKRNGKVDSFQMNILQNHFKSPITISPVNDIENVNLLGNRLLLPDYKVDYKDYIKKKYIDNKKNFGIDQRFSFIGSCNNCIDTFNYNDVLLTSDTYESILTTKKCPYKAEELSDEIVDKIAIRRGLLKRLGYKINKRNVEQGSTITDTYYSKQEKAFIELIKLNCDKDPSIFPLGKIQKILTSLGINIDLLNLLSFEHYRRTFYISCYQKLTENFEAFIDQFK